MKPNASLMRVAIAACAAALALPAHAAPTRVSAGAGEIRDIRYVSGSGASAVLLAGTQGGGLFRSADAGATWSLVTSFPGRYVWRIAVSPGSASRIYAATETGLYKTTDGGTTWTQLTGDTTTAVAIDPGSTTTDTLLVGVPGNGILKSTDSGSTFTRASSGLDSSHPLHIAYSSSSLAYAILRCNLEDGSQSGNFGGVFKTTNGGGSWTSINTLGITLPTKCVTSLAVAGTTVLVGTIPPGNPGAGKIHKTTTSDAAWSNPADGNPSVGSIFGVEHLGAQAGSTTTFWAGAREVGVWKSVDSGATWTQQVTTGTDPDVFSGIYAIGTIPSSGTVVAGVKGLGAMRSTTGASPWTPPSGLTADRVRSLSNHESVAAGTYYMALENGGVMKSVNSGSSWSQLNNGLQVNQDYIRNPQVIAASPSDTSKVYVGMYANGLYTLNVGTSTWGTGVAAGLNDGGVVHKPQSLRFNLGGDKVFYSLFDSGTPGPGGLYAGSAANTLASTGIPFYESNPGLGVSPGAYRVVISPADGNRVYLVVYDSLPYRSANGGSTWARVAATHTGFMRLGFYDIADKPATATSVATTNKGIYRSQDGGANWTRVSASGLTQVSLSSLTYSSNGKLWGGDLGGGFWCSNDDGTTWQAVSLGSLPAVPIREVRFLNGQVHALTDGAGVYKNDPATCP